MSVTHGESVCVLALGGSQSCEISYARCDEQGAYLGCGGRSSRQQNLRRWQGDEATEKQQGAARWYIGAQLWGTAERGMVLTGRTCTLRQ